MRIYYSAIFREDVDDPKWWNVSIPDVWGAVTCGSSLENARFMAKDLLESIYNLSPKQFGFPTPLEETQKNFPNDLVEQVEVEIDDNFEYSILPKSKRQSPIIFSFSHKHYKFYGSLFDCNNSKIYVLNDDYSMKEEIEDKEQKYKLLQVARSMEWEKMMNKINNR